MNILWKDKKRPIFGLPLSFTTYQLLEEKLLIDIGLIFKRQEEVRLYRIMDITLRQNILQRIFGVGTIHCSSADQSTPDFDIKDIKSITFRKQIIYEEKKELELNNKKEEPDIVDDMFD